MLPAASGKRNCFLCSYLPESIGFMEENGNLESIVDFLWVLQGPLGYSNCSVGYFVFLAVSFGALSHIKNFNFLYIFFL